VTSTRLDRNPKRIRKGKASRSDSVIADAKAPDMGGGRQALGPIRDKNGCKTDRWKTPPDFLDDIREVLDVR